LFQLVHDGGSALPLLFHAKDGISAHPVIRNG
jgi:hypothetical protein